MKRAIIFICLILLTLFIFGCTQEANGNGQEPTGVVNAVDGQALDCEDVISHQFLENMFTRDVRILNHLASGDKIVYCTSDIGFTSGDYKDDTYVQIDVSYKEAPFKYEMSLVEMEDEVDDYVIVPIFPNNIGSMSWEAVKVTGAGKVNVTESKIGFLTTNEKYFVIVGTSTISGNDAGFEVTRTIAKEVNSNLN